MELTTKCICLLSVFSFLVGYHTCLETHTVTTEIGDIIGSSRTLLIKDEQHTTRRFLGIPYAKPPIGDLRFRKPVKHGSFVEPFKALQFGSACPQITSPLIPIPEGLSEDCLFLSIYVPTSRPDNPNGHPVMVFVHGGGFDVGSGSIYIGDTLASFGNVIIVTINYRLNVFGFFSTKDEDDAPGNLGLWDQHLAFKWVHNNIGAFGGDTGRVTIFGESAGGVSVLMQSLYPGNKGLFQRVIAESGSALMWGAFKEDNTVGLATLAGVFNCEKDDIINCLKPMNSSIIVEKLSEVMQKDVAAAMLLSFRPTIDNEFFKIPPIQMAEKKDESSEEIEFFQSLDVINGVNSDEGIFVLAFAGASNGTEAFEPTREVMNTQLVNTASMFFTTEKLTDLVVKLILNEYTDWSNPDEPKTIRTEYARLLGDVMFNVGAIEQTRMHCSSQATGRNFFYIFAADSRAILLPKPSWCKGTMHGDEVAFVFGFDEEMLELVKGSDNGDANTEHGIQVWESDLSERMMRYWSNFAAYGDPNGLDDTVKEWPQYFLDTQETIVISDKTTTIQTFPYARSANFWTNIIPAAFNVSRNARASDSLTSGTESCSAEGECDEV